MIHIITDEAQINMFGFGRMKVGDFSLRGNFRFGQLEGKGELKTKDMTIRGNFSNGLLHGHAIVRKKDRTYFSGYFSYGEIKGWGCLIQNKTLRIGEFANGKLHGRGVLILPLMKFKGQFKNGVLEGLGTSTVKDAKTRMNYTYAGEWRKGYQSGKGIEILQNGDKYEGDFLNGVRQGYGRFQSTRLHLIYEGTWHKGKKSGLGQLQIHNYFIMGYFYNDYLHGIAQIKEMDEAQQILPLIYKPTYWMHGIWVTSEQYRAYVERNKTQLRTGLYFSDVQKKPYVFKYILTDTIISRLLKL